MIGGKIQILGLINMLKRSESAVDQVIGAIELGIREARFAPGQRLIEPELMIELGVSRGPIREALRRLTAKGLVEWERFRGARVVRMSRQQVIDLTNIRAVLESYAASLAAEKIDAKGIAALKKLERQGTAAVASSRSYDEYNIEFHKFITNLSGNHELPDFVERTKFSIFRLQFNTILLSPKHIPRSRADHAKIAQAIMEKDSRSAADLMTRHIKNTTAGILEAPAHFFST
jgi:DNA-binding GntR family transcriptional regulator